MKKVVKIFGEYKRPPYICGTKANNMTNSQINQAFLSSTTSEMRNIILSNISNHYAISTAEVLDELFDEESENLMDYITGPNRSAISVIYQKFIYQLSK